MHKQVTKVLTTQLYLLPSITR